MHPVARPGKFDCNIHNLTTVLHEYVCMSMYHQHTQGLLPLSQIFKISTTFLELLYLLPSWVVSPEDGSRHLLKRNVCFENLWQWKKCLWMLVVLLGRFSSGNIKGHYMTESQPNYITSHSEKPFSKIFDLTQNHPPHLSKFYSRLPPSKRFLPWYSVHNFRTYLSYNGIIISSMVLFCHFTLKQGIIQCLLVMRCNQILSSLSPSDKYDFVICARSRNYAFHRSVIQADKKKLGNPTSFYVFWFNDYMFLLISPLPVSDRCLKPGRPSPYVKPLD
jgi:hypothetical protein